VSVYLELDDGKQKAKRRWQQLELGISHPHHGFDDPHCGTTNLDITEVLTSTMATVIATLGAGTVAGRYLLGYRPQREITPLESQQLT
jgi:hypothetical protein